MGLMNTHRMILQIFKVRMSMRGIITPSRMDMI